MPHATTMPQSGFQALILCGPGASLNTFTSNPKDFPKALVPIANRPMVWYPLEWCYRMGVSKIQLVTPPESSAALKDALRHDPHLSALSTPKPDVLAPEDLTATTGTAEIFRLPEVQAAITGDFIVLPCDLICDLDGASLLDTWMIQQGGLGGATGGLSSQGPIPMGIGGEESGRRGGLGVWYQTKGENGIKGEETDFIITTPITKSSIVPPSGSLRPYVEELVYSTPTSTLNDITEANKGLPIRHSLLKKHARVKMLTTQRDAHVYFFPFWVAGMMKQNEAFDSIGEDVLCWWAKAGWQAGLSDKIGLREILEKPQSRSGEDSLTASGLLDQQVNVAKLTSTGGAFPRNGASSVHFASRVRESVNPTAAIAALGRQSKVTVPPILAYIHPSTPDAPFIRRVDTAPALLATSLYLAKLPSVKEAGEANASPYAHTVKVSQRSPVPRQCRVESQNSLIADNVEVGERCNVKESVVGANCKIGTGARLMRCILMEGAVVGDNCQLTGCVLGRRCKIEGGDAKKGDRTVLKDCEVQEGHVVEWGTEAKDEKFVRFDGLNDDGAIEDLRDDNSAEGFGGGEELGLSYP